MKKIIFFLLATSVPVLLVTESCNKDLITDPIKSIKVDLPQAEKYYVDSLYKDQCDDLSTYIYGLTHYQTETPSAQQFGNPTSEVNGGIICTQTPVSWAPTFDVMYSFNPNSDMYPGRIFNGNSFVTGDNTPIVMGRDSILISISIPTKPGEKPFVWVKNPNSIAELREGMNTLLQRTVPGATAALVNFEVKQIFASEEVNKRLGAHGSGWGASIEANYNTSGFSKKTKVLVRFFQVYYSLDIDPVERPCFLFNPVPSAEQAQASLGGTSPVIISSVNYGRAVYYMVESDSSFSKVEKALKASYSRWGMKAGVDLSAEDVETLSSSTIKALIIGGAADGAVQSINGVDQLKNFIEEGGDFSADNNLGVPISYQAKFLDNTTAKIVFAGNYQINDCEPYTEERILDRSSSANPWDGCPERYHGDNEFGDPGVKITGKVRLVIREDRKAVMAILHFDWDEPSDDNWGNDTRAAVTDTIVAYEVNQTGMLISGFEMNPVSDIDYTQIHHGNFHPPFSGNYLQDIEIQADGDGDDLPCVGYRIDADARAFVRVIFKDTLKVKVRFN